MAERFEAVDNQRIDVEVCGCCDNPHKLVELVSYKKTRSPYTHYFICPKLGDPVSLCIMQRGTSIVEVNAKCVDALVAAEQAGSYVFAVFYPNAGEIRCDRVGWNFSTKNYETVIDVMQKNLRQETHPPEKANLRTVPPPKPALPLFGDVETVKVGPDIG